MLGTITLAFNKNLPMIENSFLTVANSLVAKVVSLLGATTDRTSAVS